MMHRTSFFKVRAPSMDEVALLKEGQTPISFWPAQNPI